MDATIHNIQQKIDAIQNGLLRYRYNGKTVSLHVKIAVNDGDTLNCIVSGELPMQTLLNKNVTLIQKDHENYMYIGGRITNQAQKNTLILSIDIKKACWFIRKRKGSVTWLQEKCVYMPQEMNLAS
jgi:hypothetical protein